MSGFLLKEWLEAKGYPTNTKISTTTLVFD